MRKANIEIREMMHAKRVPAWAIAVALGVHENTVLRHLRTELNSVERDRVLKAIEKIAAANDEKEADANA